MNRALRALAVTVLMFSLPAFAADYTVGAIRISSPWTRVVPDASKVAGGFLTITNTGKDPDTLIGGTVVAAERIEVHEMAVTDGVMRMRELKPGLVVKPGETIALKPGSYHLMFMQLKQPLRQGAPIKGTLVFEKAGTVEIEYMVEPFGARASGDSGNAAKSGKGSGSGSGSGSGMQKSH